MGLFVICLARREIGYMTHVSSILTSKTPGASQFLNYSKMLIYGSVIPKCVETEPMYLAMCVY